MMIVENHRNALIIEFTENWMGKDDVEIEIHAC